MAKAQAKSEAVFPPAPKREIAEPSENGFSRGGPVADLHAQITERLVPDDAAPRVMDEAGLVAFWEVDQRPTEQAITFASRVIGIAALFAGFAATTALLAI